MSKKKNTQVFMDISIGTKPAGRVIFELFNDITPRTSENFRGLCTGEYENKSLTDSSKPLHYINSTFHRIIENFVIQGGDITRNDGSGGLSIYGQSFNDENFQRRHACAGLLSMANRGRNTNSSQFFITLKACPHLDGKHVVFGQVIEGMDVVRTIAKTPTDMRDKPKIPIIIINSGEVGSAFDFLRYDPFKKKQQEEIQEQQESDNEQEDKQNVKDPNVVEEDSLKIEDLQKKLSTPMMDKLNALKLRINEAKVMNNKAVIDEEKQANDPYYEKNKKKQEWVQKSEVTLTNTVKRLDYI